MIGSEVEWEVAIKIYANFVVGCGGMRGPGNPLLKWADLTVQTKREWLEYARAAIKTNNQCALPTETT